MILAKLEPEQIAVHWPLIKNAVFASLPPFAVKDQNRAEFMASAIYTDLIEGQMQVWFWPLNEVPPKNVIVTSVLWDEHSRTSSLCVYAFWEVPQGLRIGQERKNGMMSAATWKSGIEEIYAFAKGLGCRQIIAYTLNTKISDILRALSFNEQRCWTLEIRE